MSSNLGKSFVTEDEVAEKRQRRQKEWEKVRGANDPLEAPEDDRPLFDRLSEQRQKQRESWEEEQREKNRVKGLDEDEVRFLEQVDDQKDEIEKIRHQEFANIMKEIDDYVVKPSATAKSEDISSKKPQPVAAKTKSQASLLAGAIRRKRESGSKEDVFLPPKQLKKEVSALRPVGILPGLGPYSSSETSDSDSEPEICPLITSAKTVTDSDS